MAAIPKGPVATETQWMSDEQANKLAQDPKNRVFRWAEGRQVAEMPAETVYKIVKFWRAFVDRNVAEWQQENRLLLQEDMRRLMEDEERRFQGDDKAALKKFREDLPKMYETISAPVLPPNVLNQVYQLILDRVRVQRGELSITKEEMLAKLIENNKRPPTEAERALIASGKATSLDSVGFLQNRGKK
jgi:hypothetical protein